MAQGFRECGICADIADHILTPYYIFWSLVHDHLCFLICFSNYIRVLPESIRKADFSSGRRLPWQVEYSAAIGRQEPPNYVPALRSLVDFIAKPQKNLEPFFAPLIAKLSAPGVSSNKRGNIIRKLADFLPQYNHTEGESRAPLAIGDGKRSSLFVVS
jgi:hypothetical protein